MLPFSPQCLQISLVSLKIYGAFVKVFDSVCVPVEARESETMVLLRVVLAGFMQIQFSSRLWGSASYSNSFKGTVSSNGFDFC